MQLDYSNICKYVLISFYIIQIETVKFDQPADQIIECGIKTSIIWNIKDINPFKYNVTKDRLLVIESISWTNKSIVFIADILPIGSYNFTRYAFDLGGNVVNDSVIITIIEVSSPSSILTIGDTSSPPAFLDFTSNSVTILSLVTISHILISRKRR